MISSLLVLAVAPAIALGLGVFLTDRYDREPPLLLLKVFIFGAVSVVPAIIIEKLLQHYNVFNGIFGAFYTAFFVAGLVEELFKREAVKYTALYHRAFDEKLDGIVYAVFSALGFATVENLMYIFLSYTNNYYVALMRGVFSVPGHAMFGVTMGYYLSLSHFATTERARKYFSIQSLVVPITIHGAFDFILMANIPFATVIFVLYILGLWAISLVRLNKYTSESKRDFHARRMQKSKEKLS